MWVYCSVNLYLPIRTLSIVAFNLFTVDFHSKQPFTLNLLFLDSKFLNYNIFLFWFVFVLWMCFVKCPFTKHTMYCIKSLNIYCALKFTKWQQESDIQIKLEQSKMTTNHHHLSLPHYKHRSILLKYQKIDVHRTLNIMDPKNSNSSITYQKVCKDETHRWSWAIWYSR